YPNASISGKMVALISAIGASINTNLALGKGMQSLMEAGVNPMAAHSSMRNVNVQFVVEDGDYNSAICALHQALISQNTSVKTD
ncbi:hypothetical protein, partial [Bacillus cereus group sp. Bce009]